MRILVFLEGEAYVRNYIRTAVFDELVGHEVYFALAESMRLKEEVERRGVVAGEVGATRMTNLSFQLASVLQMRERGAINPNFTFRLLRDYAPVLLHRRFGHEFGRLLPNSALRRRIASVVGDANPLGRSILRAAGLARSAYVYGRALPGLAKYGAIVALHRLGLRRPLHSLLLNWLPLNRSVKEVLERVRPDLVILPSSVVGSLTYEFVRTIKRMKTPPKSLVLVDNWDNLSSKSAFIQNPDYLGVWGEQSIEFAERFHMVARNRVRAIGSPRFEVYWEYILNASARRSEEKGDAITRSKLPAHPYILFAGCAVGFDELGALEAVNDALDSRLADFPAGTKILYRPHPWGPLDAYLERLKTLNLRHVLVDPQIRDRSSAEVGAAFQPDLAYYPMLLDRSLFVVCPLSSLLIESTIMGKRVLVLAHDDGASLLAPSRMLENYVHFRGLERLKGITIVEDLADCGPAMLDALRSDVPAGCNELDYFVASSRQSTYRERLGQLIGDIAREGLDPPARPPQRKLPPSRRGVKAGAESMSET